MHLLKHRAQVYRVRLAIRERQLSLREAFYLFDPESKGRLTTGMLSAGLEWLGVSSSCSSGGEQCTSR